MKDDSLIELLINHSIISKTVTCNDGSLVGLILRDHKPKKTNISRFLVDVFFALKKKRC